MHSPLFGSAYELRRSTYSQKKIASSLAPNRTSQRGIGRRGCKGCKGAAAVPHLLPSVRPTCSQFGWGLGLVLLCQSGGCVPIFQRIARVQVQVAWLSFAVSLTVEAVVCSCLGSVSGAA